MQQEPFEPCWELCDAEIVVRMRVDVYMCVVLFETFRFSLVVEIQYLFIRFSSELAHRFNNQTKLINIVKMQHRVTRIIMKIIMWLYASLLCSSKYRAWRRVGSLLLVHSRASSLQGSVVLCGGGDVGARSGVFGVRRTVAPWWWRISEQFYNVCIKYLNTIYVR